MFIFQTAGPGFYSAAVSATSCGAGIFFIGSCCTSCTNLTRPLEFEPKKFAEAIKSINEALEGNTNKIQLSTEKKAPLDPNIDTVTFLEEKGLMRFPEDLINYIDFLKKAVNDPTCPHDIPPCLYLEGPPGNGKTTIAHLISDILGGTFQKIKTAEVKSKWYGETEKIVKTYLEVPEGEFRILFIDEITEILGDREKLLANNPMRVITQNFLSAIPGLDSDIIKTDKKVGKFLLIGTTNDINDLDLAARRPGRAMSFRIDNPTKEARAKIFLFRLKKNGFGKAKNHNENSQGESDTKLSTYAEHLAAVTDGFSCADIRDSFDRMNRDFYKNGIESSNLSEVDLKKKLNSCIQAQKAQKKLEAASNARPQATFQTENLERVAQLFQMFFGGGQGSSHVQDS